MAKKQDQISKESAENAAFVTASYEKGLITLSQMDGLLDKILNKQLKSKEAVLQAVIAEESQKDTIEARNKLLDRQIAKEQQSVKTNEDLTSILNTQRKNTKDLVDDFVEMADLTDEQAKSKLKEIQIQKKQLKEQFNYRNLTWEQKDAYSEILRKLEEQEDVLSNLAKLQDNKQAKALAGAFEEANDAVDAMEKSIKGFFDSVPGGGILGKVLGADSFSKQMKGEVTNAFSAMNKDIATGGGLMGALKTGAAGFNKIIMVNPLLLVVAAGAALFGILKESEEQGRKLAETSGMDLLNSQRLVDATQARNTKAGELLASTEDLLAVQSEVISQMGPMAELSQDVASNIAETSKAFGYSAKTGGEVQTTFMQMGATAEEAAKSQQKLAADAFKAGVPVGQVMEDIAKNSRVAARYMGDSTEEITEAAIEAAKLGMGLDDLASIADGLLDIEDSLTSQFEYQALTGKEINLDKAREFALQGKLTDMAKELSKEVGDIHDFNAMTVIERDKLAKSMGMETDQLQKMLAMDKVREKVGEKLADQAAELGMDANELADLAPEELEKKIAQTRETEKMQKAMADMAEDIKSMLLPVAKAFMSVLSGVLSIVKLILIPFKFIFDVVGALVEKFPIIGTALKIIGGLMLLNWLYSKWKLRDEKKSLEKRLEAMEMQKKMNKLKKFEAQQAAKTTKEEKAQTKEQKEQNDLSGKAQQQAQQKKGGGGLLGKLKNAVGFGEGGVLSKLGGAAMGMLGGGGGGGMIPGFATGGDVKSTGIAKVHAGERVIPAKKVAGSEPKGNSSNESMDYNKMGSAMATAMKSMPAPEISMDGKRVSESVTANQSFDKGFM